MSIALVIPSSHLILLLLPPIFPRNLDFSNELAFASFDQNAGASASASVLPKSSQCWFPWRLTGLVSLLFKGLSRVFSCTTVWRHQFFGVLPSLWSSSHNCMWPLGRPYHYYMDLCQQSNVSAFQHTVWVCHSFPAKKQSSSDFMTVVTTCSDFKAQEEEICHYFHPSIPLLFTIK